MWPSRTGSWQLTQSKVKLHSPRTSEEFFRRWVWTVRTTDRENLWTVPGMRSHIQAPICNAKAEKENAHVFENASVLV